MELIYYNKVLVVCDVLVKNRVIGVD